MAIASLRPDSAVSEGMTMPLTVERIVQYEQEATRFYYLWFAIYFILGLGAIILPGCAAMGLTFGITDGSKYLAGIGGLCAAAYGFVKPNEYAASFDASIAKLRSLNAAFDQLQDKERTERLDICLQLMTFQYQGAVPTSFRRNE